MAADRIRFFISTYDVSVRLRTPGAFGAAIVGETKKALARGHRIILFPEYAACALHQIRENGKPWGLGEIARNIWGEVAPELQALSLQYGALICAGTAPFQDGDQFTNRALLWADGKEIRYEKAKLTPWEGEFRSGNGPVVFSWNSLKVAPLICFDVEFPEIAVQLKQNGVDLILCPSATSDVLGSERVHRCASSRAVELGAVALVSPLLGKDLKNPLVDINVGHPAVYYPSQEAFKKMKRGRWKVFKTGRRTLTGVIDVKALQKMKTQRTQETCPFLV